MRGIFLMVVLTVLASDVWAINADESLPDPALEARAREISKELRCLVCQNQSIDESDADLAKDLRRIVRERLDTGATDDQVKDFIVARYGDFVLLKPPFKTSTYALWFGPVIMLVLATIGVAVYLRRQSRHTPPNVNLSAAERQRLDDLFKND